MNTALHIFPFLAISKPLPIQPHLPIFHVNKNQILVNVMPNFFRSIHTYISFWIKLLRSILSMVYIIIVFLVMTTYQLAHTINESKCFVLVQILVDRHNQRFMKCFNFQVHWRGKKGCEPGHFYESVAPCLLWFFLNSWVEDIYCSYHWK